MNEDISKQSEREARHAMGIVVWIVLVLFLLFSGCVGWFLVELLERVRL